MLFTYFSLWFVYRSVVLNLSIKAFMQEAISLDGRTNDEQIVERSESEQTKGLSEHLGTVQWCLKIRSHCNRTNYRPAKKFNRSLRSLGTVQYFRPVHKELWSTARRLNFCTVRVKSSVWAEHLNARIFNRSKNSSIAVWTDVYVASHVVP